MDRARNRVQFLHHPAAAELRRPPGSFSRRRNMWFPAEDRSQTITPHFFLFFHPLEQKYGHKLGPSIKKRLSAFHCTFFVVLLHTSSSSLHVFRRFTAHFLFFTASFSAFHCTLFFASLHVFRRFTAHIFFFTARFLGFHCTLFSSLHVLWGPRKSENVQ